jgi:hypothetical protein
VPRPPWYRNYHGLAEIYTGSLSYYLSQNWFVRLNVSQIHAPGDVDTRLVLLGTGLRLDGLFEHAGSNGSGEAGPPPALNQLGVFAGQTAENNYYTSYFNENTLTFGAEYRRSMTAHLELSAAWLSEDDGLDGRHNGALGEIWLTNTFGRLSLGIGAGPYYALQPHRGDDGTYEARFAGVVSMTAAWQLTRSLIARINWHRSITHDDQDRDIITAGLAWVWGH